MTDGLQPGLAQLGSVWLPVPHLLLVPLVAYSPWWHDGIAGAIVGGGCFVYSATRLFALIHGATGSTRAAWVGFGVYIANLNLLYLQSTALTEPVLLAFFIGTVLHLERWMRSRSMWDLMLAGGMVMLATLSRYDGWFLLAVATVVVVTWSRTHERRSRATEANLVLFLSIGLFGVLLWVLYNLIIFGDPLYFIHSSFSAQSQQVALSHVGMLQTNGRLIDSLLTYGWTVIDVVGPIMFAGTAVCCALLLLARGAERPRMVAVLALLAAPPVFNVLSLWTGQSTIRVPQQAPFGMWNDRYGLMALPLAAFAIGAVAARKRWWTAVAVGAAAASCLIMAAETPLTIQDGRTGTSSAAGQKPELVASYLRDHYRGGEILADDGSAEPLIFATDLDLKQFVTIGFHPWYEDAIQSPGTTVRWAVAYPDDAISQDLADHPNRFAAFHLVIVDGSVRLFERGAAVSLPGGP